MTYNLNRPGRLVRVRTLTATNYTVPGGVKNLFVECYGAGGAGGLATSEVGTAGASGGGGAGGYAAGWLTVLPGTVFILNGSADAPGFSIGTGGTSPGGNGVATEMWVDQVNKITASGGNGAPAATGVSGIGLWIGGEGGEGAGLIVQRGGQGNFGRRRLTTRRGGNGGMTLLGGGRATSVSRASGGGGVGATTLDGTPGSGTAGTDGAIRVWEYSG